MDVPSDILNLQREIDYYKSQVNSLTTALISHQYRQAEGANNVSQMKRGFDLIASLHQYRSAIDLSTLYDEVTEKINVAMQMDHAMILLPVANTSHCFYPAHFRGYSSSEAEIIGEVAITLPDTLLQQQTSLLVNSQTVSTDFIDSIRSKLLLQYFILTPIIVQKETVAFVFTGRNIEIRIMAASRLLLHDVHALEAIAGVLAALKNQFDQFRMLEKERTRIAREMHDDIGAELTKIKMFSQALLKSYVSGGPEHDRLVKISGAASNVLENVNEIIWTMNSYNDRLDSLGAYIRKFASEYFESHEIEYKITIPENLLSVFVSNGFRRNIFLVIKEAIHNIIKHSNATNAVIEINYEQGQLNIHIQDNGTGFSKIESSGNGLLSMENRIKDIGGKFSISSKHNIGTAVCFEVSLIKNSNGAAG